VSTFDLTALFKAIIANSKDNIIPTQGLTLLIAPDSKEYLQGADLRFEVPTGSLATITSYLKTRKEQRTHSITCGDLVITFNVLIERQLRGSESIQFDRVVQCNKDEILKNVGIELASTLGRALLTPSSKGKLVLGTPNLESATALNELVSKFLSSEMIATASAQPLSQAVICVADDLVDLIMKQRWLKEEDIICSVALVSKNCPYCSRSAKPDLELVHKLPDAYQQRALSLYQIGRGCERCAHAGVAREQWVDSTVIAGTSLVEMMKGRLVESLIADEVAALGGCTLIEKLFGKVASGELSLESMIKSLGATLSRTSPLFLIQHTSKAKTEMSSVSEVKRVLIVEDDVDQAEILSLVLQQSSYEVVVAHDGNEGLTALEKEHFDLVISDLMMPRMDGVQLVSQIRKKRNMVPILILTVLGDEERECALLALGADDYCAKTIHKRTLVKRIEALLRRAAL
jgi:CheY-like chemotaxis protein